MASESESVSGSGSEPFEGSKSESVSGSGSEPSEGSNSQCDSTDVLELLCQSPDLAVEDYLSKQTEPFPLEILECFEAKGWPDVQDTKKFKYSLNETWLVRFVEPLSIDGGPKSDMTEVFVQIIGAELVDKEVFHSSARNGVATIMKALELARAAGICVARVLASGASKVSRGALLGLDFIVYEKITTDTVDPDMEGGDGKGVRASMRGWKPIESDIWKQLGALDLTDVDTNPLARFECVHDQLKYLIDLATQAGALDVSAGLQSLTADFRDKWHVQSVCPTLVHLDLHPFNTCSRNGDAWKLDAVIDWESAFVGDARLATAHDEPWDLLRKFSAVTKARWLAAELAAGRKIPRCDLHQCTADNESRKLVKCGRLPQHQPFGEVYLRLKGID